MASQTQIPPLSTQDLPSSALFNVSVHSLSAGERAHLSFVKARTIAAAYNLSLEDITKLSTRFWNLHLNPIISADGAATTLITIQYNLVLGTILDHIGDRTDLDQLLQDMLQYRICGQFCLTEVDHGLDAINVETTATSLGHDGGFILHTPHSGAAKYMPPTIPCGIPCVAIIMAKHIVDGVDYGVKPFLVPLNDGKIMYRGITARLLPPRGGSNPLNHAITSFDQVYLPKGALLGQETLDLDNKRFGFLMSIWRVAVGSLALGGTIIPCLGKVAVTAGRYSQRRFVAGGGSFRVPIIQFKTQQAPILAALSQSFVLKAFFSFATRLFSDDSADFRVRHGIAASFKVIAVRHGQDANLALSERCGAQGLFGHNGISELHADMRGIAIAEGDLLGISIRLASELVLNRYSLPASPHPTSPLSLHEQGLISDCREALKNHSDHRSDDFSRILLPRCQLIVEAIGQRFAYDAAVDAGLDDTITDIYLTTAMLQDAVWYSENLGMSQKSLFAREEKALKKALPKLDEWMDMTGGERYITAPILSAEKWSAFVEGLEVYSSPSVTHIPQERSRL